MVFRFDRYNTKIRPYIHHKTSLYFLLASIHTISLLSIHFLIHYSWSPILYSTLYGHKILDRYFDYTVLFFLYLLHHPHNNHHQLLLFHFENEPVVYFHIHLLLMEYIEEEYNIPDNRKYVEIIKINNVLVVSSVQLKTFH